MATAPHRFTLPGDRTLYFPLVTTLLLALSLLAFADNLFTDVGQPSNRDPKMIVHSLFAFGWVTMLAVQAWLVRTRRVARHRRIDAWGFLIGAGLAASTLFVFVAGFRGFEAMSGEVLANRLLLPVFAVFTWLAWRQRNRPERHKRFLLMGTFALLSPIISRTFVRIFWIVYPDPNAAEADFAFVLYFLGLWGSFLASLWVYDFATMRRVHPITLVGSALVAGIVLGVDFFWQTGD